MANKLNYKNMSYSELVNCRDFGKIDIKFVANATWFISKILNWWIRKTYR